MIICNILIVGISLFFLYRIYKQSKTLENKKTESNDYFKQELARLEDKFNSVIKKDEELDDELNEAYEEFKKKLELDKKKELVVTDKWFTENLPADIKTLNDMNMFTTGINKINDQLMTGDMQLYLSSINNDKKRKLIIRLAQLNRKYINFKNNSYRLFDNFLITNEEVLSENSIMKLKNWADTDINESIKVSSGYLNFNSFIQATME